MTDDAILSDIRERVSAKNIHELRQIARAVGIARPTDGKKKSDLIEEIIKIASCESAPAPCNRRGAPVKSTSFDDELVADIERAVKYFSAQKNGTGIVDKNISVADGADENACAGVLVKTDKYYFLRTEGCFASLNDVYVDESFIDRFKLDEGDLVCGFSRRRHIDEAPSLVSVSTVNGFAPLSLRSLKFSELTPVYPEKRIRVEISGDITLRMIDMFAPLGRGQRAVLSGAAGSVKTMLVQRMLKSAGENNPDLDIVVLSVGARPEDVTEYKRACNGKQFYFSTFDMDYAKQAESAAFAASRCKSIVSRGGDCILFIDGITRYEEICREIGMRGGARKLLASAISAEEGGSLTIVAALSENNEEDRAINSELLEAANSRIVIKGTEYDDQYVPDIIESGTARCRLLQSDEERATADNLRSNLAKSDDYRKLIEIFTRTASNDEVIKGY